MKITCPLIFLVLLLSALISKAQETTQVPPQHAELQQERSETPTQLIEINNVKNPDWKSYKTMLKGLDAFEK
ncbi:hypothetical protein, partial [Undibacterium sp.]|uniref:hypothetical protein n=1 Tax=Undibacterium sp. TaxID=1914977 RepID=UPI003750FC6B